MLTIDPNGFLDIGPITTRYNNEFLDILNVKYLIKCRCKVSTTDNEYKDTLFKHNWHESQYIGKKWQPVYKGEEVTIYENIKVSPRAFILHSALFTKSEAESYSALRKKIDLKKIAVIELPSSEKKREIERLLAGSMPGKDTVEISSYSPQRIKINAFLASPGILVLGDTYEKHWKAYVDGSQVDVYPVDYLLRGIFLEKGNHLVEFIYDPLSFKLGSFISLVTFVLIMGMVIITAVQNNLIFPFTPS